MIELLVYEENGEILSAGKVEKGKFENDPENETYRVTTPDGEIYYAVLEGFKPYMVEDCPEDYENYQYFPDKGFVEKPKRDISQEIAELRRRIDELERIENDKYSI